MTFDIFTVPLWHPWWRLFFTVPLWRLRPMFLKRGNGQYYKRLTFSLSYIPVPLWHPWWHMIFSLFRCGIFDDACFSLFRCSTSDQCSLQEGTGKYYRHFTFFTVIYSSSAVAPFMTYIFTGPLWHPWPRLTFTVPLWRLWPMSFTRRNWSILQAFHCGAVAGRMTLSILTVPVWRIESFSCFESHFHFQIILSLEFPVALWRGGGHSCFPCSAVAPIGFFFNPTSIFE